MTFNFAPWAIDGAKIDSNLARRGVFASAGPIEGVVSRADLKVSQLSVAGQGLLISPGNLLILNRYQDVISESYVIANPGVHTVPASSMPSAQSVAKSYLVMVTVGDPEFSQQGHPWMTSDELTDEQAAVFEYIRVFLIEVPAGTTSFKSLNKRYPAYAIARLDIPANTTTIINDYIKDIRKVARPRVSDEMYVVNGMTSNYLNAVSPAWESWGTNAPVVDIPDWASVAKIDAWVEAAEINRAINGGLRVAVVGGGTTPTTPLNRSGPAGGVDRAGFNLGGKIDVTALAGTARVFRIEGTLSVAAQGNGLRTDNYTSSMIRIRFEEAPI